MVLQDGAQEQCQLLEGISSEDLDVFELLRGVTSHELRKEMLKKRDPRASKLIKKPQEWEYSRQMDKTSQALTVSDD